MSSTLVLDAHPNPDSFCAALSRSYAEAHPDARLLPLRDLEFDVHLRYGYTQRMPIEPDLAQARAAIREASHLVVVTPVWWRSVPALLKGFLDRALLPQEDYRYKDNGFPEGLLTGRTGRVVATADTPPALSYVMPDTRLATLRNGTLKFCGISPVAFDYLGPVKTSDPAKRQAWLELVAARARLDGQRPAARPAGVTTA